MRKKAFLMIALMIVGMFSFSAINFVKLGKAWDDSTVTFSDFMTSFKSLADNYPSYAFYNTSGQSYQGTNLTTFYIGSGPSKLMIDASIHPWEYYGSLALYYFVQWLLTSASTNATASSLLSDCTLICTPVVNPDGWAQTRKNLNYTVSSSGVNLNRNFLPAWSTGPSDPNSADYRGSSPIDQNESIAINNLMLSAKPQAFLDLHVYGANKDYPNHTNDGTFLWDWNNSTQFNNTCTELFNTYLKVSYGEGVSVADSGNSSPAGTSEDQALQDGIPAAMTFEITDNITDANRGTGQKPTDVATLRMSRLRAFVIAFDDYPKTVEFGMKTKNDGFFNWPNTTYAPAFDYLKIEETFTNVSGDIWGKIVSGYPFNWPDGKVDGKDMTIIAAHMYEDESSSGWLYSADIWQGRDTAYCETVSGQDLAYVYSQNGNTNVYNTTTSGLYLNFSTNTRCYNLQVDYSGFMAVPTGIGTINNYTVNDGNGNKLGAFITFWKSGSSLTPYCAVSVASSQSAFYWSLWQISSNSATQGLGYAYYPKGTVVTFDTNNTAIGYQGSAWYLTGWTGTGDINSTTYADPKSNSQPLNFTVTINDDSSIQWNWERYENVTVFASYPQYLSQPSPAIGYYYYRSGTWANFTCMVWVQPSYQNWFYITNYIGTGDIPSNNYDASGQPHDARMGVPVTITQDSSIYFVYSLP